MKTMFIPKSGKRKERVCHPNSMRENKTALPFKKYKKNKTVMLTDW